MKELRSGFSQIEECWGSTTRISPQQGQVFAAAAYGNGGGLATLGRDADGSVQVEEVYFTNKMQNHHGGMILFDGSLSAADLRDIESAASKIQVQGAPFDEVATEVLTR